MSKPIVNATVKHDLETYLRLLSSGEDGATRAMLRIEERYGLDGYPPPIVAEVLGAGARGDDMVAAEDRAIGAGEDQ